MGRNPVRHLVRSLGSQFVDPYQLQYEVSADRVRVDKKPKDCEFLTAPLGRKNCDYEKEVSVWTYSKDAATGRPTVSYDGSKWEWNDGGPESGKQVNVWWKRVDE
jgi:hypothetical protein